MITCLFCIGCLSSINNIRSINTSDLISQKEFTFMTFNIQAGCGYSTYGISPQYCKVKNKDLIFLVEAIKSVDPDIVALQEVRGFYQAKLLATQLNLNFVYSTHGNFWGLAILSKHPIENFKTHTINPSYNPRIALTCEILIGNKLISFVNVHYHLGNYKNQVKSTIHTLKKENNPIVLLGDLNRDPSDKVLEPIYNRLIDTCKVVKTQDAQNVIKHGTCHGYLIDYIFLDSSTFDVKNASLIPSKYKWASDHKAYYTTVTLKK